MIDALGSGKGNRLLTRDVIGCGPRWICGILESHDVKCQINLAEEFLGKGGTGVDVELLLVSAMSMDLSATKKVARRASKNLPNARKIVGGPISGNPEKLLRAGFDIVVIGEGEKAIEAILNNTQPSDIPGIAYVDDRETVINPVSEGLGQVEYENYHPSTNRIVDYPTFWASRVYVEVVRGCSNFNRTRMPTSRGRRCTECMDDCRDARCPEEIPVGCGFCAIPATFGSPKSRRVDSVAEEIDQLVGAGVKRIVLSAPDILDFHRGSGLKNPRKPEANIALLRELFEAATNSAGDRAKISIENAKSSLLSEEIIRLIAETLPSTEIHIGCETGDEAHSRALGRPSTPMETLEAVRTAKKHGLRPYVYFIHGLPGQTVETAGSTASLMRRMEPFVEKITAYRFKPLPGSAFELEAPGNPRWKDESSLMISEAAADINRKKKGSYLGRTIEGYLVEKNFQRRGELIFYPDRGGPIVTVGASSKLIGRRAKVKVTRIVSERLLSGEIVEMGSKWTESRS
ncbi:MAG: B12-binding domain-containing radical SAM protein [Theionarchaea archaeon]|nr:B12-binding domain-containing radical SAM protein [Theionarchaea archaeon]